MIFMDQNRTYMGKKCLKLTEKYIPDVGESGALPCMGQIRSPQFLGKLLAVYAPENAGVFLVWQTIIQHTKLQNVCNCTGENCRFVFCELL